MGRFYELVAKTQFVLFGWEVNFETEIFKSSKVLARLHHQVQGFLGKSSNFRHSIYVKAFAYGLLHQAHSVTPLT